MESQDAPRCEPRTDPAEANAAQFPFAWLPAIAARAAHFLPRNLVACTLRLLDKATSEQFSDIRIVQLSQPAPHAAFSEHWLAPAACKGLTLQKRRKLVCLVAASGDVANLEIAIQTAGCPPTEETLEAAAGAGALGCCLHLAELFHLSAGGKDRIMHAAAKGGHHAVCEWCLANGAEQSWRAVAAAYSGGHTELAELLKPAVGEPGDYDRLVILTGTAEGCSLDLLKGLWAQWGDQVMEEVGAEDDFGESFQLSMVLSAAVGSPTPDWEAKAEFLLAQGFTFNPLSAHHAVRLPPATALQRLEWMRRRGWAPGEESLGEALRAGSLEGVRWLLDAGVAVAPGGVITGVLYELSRDAPPELVQLLVTRGCIAPSKVVRSALRPGARGLPVLSWLFETYGAEVLDPNNADPDEDGEPCDMWDFDTAASGGCVEAMELVLEHGGAYGLAFGEPSWSTAAQSGCEAALEWLDQRGCPKPDDGKPYAAAAGNNDVRMLRVLRRLGLPWGESSGPGSAFASAVRNGADVATLRWLVAEGCPVDWAEARRAAEVRQRVHVYRFADPKEVLAWVKEQATAAAAEPAPMLTLGPDHARPGRRMGRKRIHEG